MPLTITKTVRLAYAENLAVQFMPLPSDKKETAPKIVIVPDTIGFDFADFEFELTYTDDEQSFRFPEDSMPKLFGQRGSSEWVPITSRTWLWKQVGSSPNIHWCYYSRDQLNHTEYNYGHELLDKLNEGMYPTTLGRYIVNKTDNQIISGSWILKRERAVDGSVPHNVGNIIIDGIEHTYESIFG